jgi:hypothetical protein
MDDDDDDDGRHRLIVFKLTDFPEIIFNESLQHLEFWKDYFVD